MIRTTTTRGAGALLACTAGLLALSGCTGSGGEGTGPTTAPPLVSSAPTTSSAVPTASAGSATPRPTATPATALLPCEDLLTAEEESSLAEDGLALAPEATAYDVDYPVVQEIAEDGVLCRWTGQGDVSVVVGQLAVPDAEWPERSDALLADGFTADDAAVPGYLDGPDGPDESYPGLGVLHRDGVLYYASYSGIIGSIVPLAG
ncbi:hypothetical protein C5C24_13315 [Rathayibacter sp. AY2B3]|uniref:hypothetical protein n=1 Tax=Rathayibacter sp. AY2B3 TaxID=2080569 RepID=UPI000CE7D8E3|nr:hypothetical protein [Rathayibacter sp. AY2B3]PPG49295.1 hypothetical protein C5C24_13315 [Rathayibacter sp. AY2B3]